jgi:hypothetical protein
MSFNAFIKFDPAAGPRGRKADRRMLNDTFGTKPEALLALRVAFQARAQNRIDAATPARYGAP